MYRFERLAIPLTWWRDKFGHRWWYWFITAPIYAVFCFYVGWFFITFSMFISALALAQLFNIIEKYWEIAGPHFPFIH